MTIENAAEMRTVARLVSEANADILLAYLFFRGDASVLDDLRAIDASLLALSRKLKRKSREGK